jgi:hypothetical protein
MEKTKWIEDKLNKIVLISAILAIPQVIGWYIELFKDKAMSPILREFLVCSTLFTFIVFVLWIWYKIDCWREDNNKIKKELALIIKTKNDIRQKIATLENYKLYNPATLGNLTNTPRHSDIDRQIEELKNKLIK